MKNKVYGCTVLTALFCALVISINVVVFAQHSHQGHDEKTQPDEALGGKSFHQLMDDAMMAMDRGMESTLMSGNPDHDFAAMMIPHHRGAIEMAKAELLYGKDPALRRLAQEIIVTQEQEIEVMRTRLKQFKDK